ncbi:hypothetical protein NC652_028272 [Populus alba x Populus x berolinensis]|nr:hypothetical protein NC652_028272 [Populus alba x Populus x berolinensis]
MTLVVHAVPQVTKPPLLCPWQLAATSLLGSSPLTRPLRRPAPRMVNDAVPGMPSSMHWFCHHFLRRSCIGKSIGPSSTRHICPLLSVLSFLRTSPRRCSVSCRTAAATLGLWFR